MAKEELYFKIKENSLRARLAARRLKSGNVAMVMGKTIYLHNVDRDAFLKDKKWLSHELKHVEQYRRLGMVRFLFAYLYYSMRYGYYHNPLEAEARAAEEDTSLEGRYRYTV